MKPPRIDPAPAANRGRAPCSTITDKTKKRLKGGIFRRLRESPPNRGERTSPNRHRLTKGAAVPSQKHLKCPAILAAAAFFIAALAGGLLTFPAQAAPITVAFSGTVNIVGTALTPTIVVGSPITGSYTFDSNAVNTSANPANTGDYAVTSFTATVGGFTFSSPGLLFVEVNTGEYSVSGSGTGGASVNGHNLDVFGLTTNNGQVITTTALPLTPPPPLPPAVYTLELSFGLPPAEGVVDGIISSIAVVDNTAVPEPGTMILLTLAMAGLTGTRLLSRGSSLIRSF